MGWRDINMNRRKPRQSFAVVPVDGALDERTAVLRKAALSAVAAAISQCAGHGDMPRQPELRAFAAGYLAGFARHQALRHGIDAEEDMDGLSAMLHATASPQLQAAVSALAFLPRAVFSARARLGAAGSLADAGYLTGHLESLCGSRKLLEAADDFWGKPDAAHRYLIACDTAADRMQTHQPTASLRFDAAERAVIGEAFSLSAG